MKLRYYLRGLGIGIAVMALVMAAVLGRDDSISDEEIKKRAAELGMVESSVLSDFTQKASESEQEPQSSITSESEVKTEEESKSDTGESKEAEELPLPEIVKEPESISLSDVSTESEKTSTIDEPSESEGVTEEENTSQTVTDEEIVIISIQSGDGSDTVSRKLFEAGLVEDSVAYDHYLCERGYDKKLRVGDYSIPRDADDAEIAEYLVNYR